MPDQKRMPPPHWSILLVVVWFYTIYITCRLVLFGLRTIFGIMGLLVGAKTDLKSRYTLRTSEKKKQQQQQQPSTSSTSSGDDDNADSSSPSPTCPICHERIGARNAEGIREGWSVLPCGHRFGSYCIKHYLGLAADEEPGCPVCRQPAFHDVCGHPVLPFVLRPDGTHPDLVAVPQPSGKGEGKGEGEGEGEGEGGGEGGGEGEGKPRLLPRKGEHFHAVLACSYCVPPPPTPPEPPAVSNAGEGRPLWRAPLAWLWGKTPFASQSQRRKSRGGNEPRGSAASASTTASTSTSTSAPVRRSSSLRNNRRERIRNQRNGGQWNGPWMDVRARDAGWELWWKEQAPRGA